MYGQWSGKSRGCPKTGLSPVEPLESFYINATAVFGNNNNERRLQHVPYTIDEGFYY